MERKNKISGMVFRNLTFLMFALVIGSSCKKDSVDPPSKPLANIEGSYAAKYGFDNETPNEPEKYSIKPGAVFQQISIYNGSVVGNGMWKLEGTTLKATVTSIFAPFRKESISAEFNSVTGKLTGTWGYNGSYTDGGKIEMQKQ